MVKAKGETKGVKMGLGDFIGSSGGTSTLPTAPRERDPTDDGRFRRTEYRRDTNSNTNESSAHDHTGRSERDGDWRGGRTNYTSSRQSSARDANNNNMDRDRYNNDRFGSSASTSSFRGDMNTNNSGRWSGGSNSRGGYDNAANSSSTAERPKLNLTKRTVPSTSTNLDSKQVVSATASTSTALDNTQIVAESSTSTATSLDLSTSNSTNPRKATEEVCPPHPSDAAEVSEQIHDTSLTGAAADNSNDSKEVALSKNATREVLTTSTRFTAAIAADKEYTMGGFRSSRRRNNEGESQPEISNSRLANAVLDDRDTKGFFRRNKNNEHGPNPIPNSRFAAAVAADPDYNSGGFRRNKEERDTATPPPLQVQNSRFAAAAAADPDYIAAGSSSGGGFRRHKDDRGTPPPPLEVQNSRFAAAVAADPDYIAAGSSSGSGFRRHKDDRGTPPPPLEVQNSRFAAAAAADPDYIAAGSSGGGSFRRHKDDRGKPPPPPLEVQNSRFAAAAAADRDYSSGDGGFRSSRSRREADQQQEQEPPLQVQNSRFAAAAAADRDYGSGDGGFRSSRRYEEDQQHQAGPPKPPSNTRFAAAIQADSEYREREDRRDFDRGSRGGMTSDGRGLAAGDRRDDRRGGGGPRWSNADGDAQQRGRNEPHQRRSDGGNRFRDDRTSSETELPRFPSSSRQETNVISAADFPPLKSTVEIAGLPKPAPPPPPVSIPIALPGEDEEAAIARIEKKKKEAEEKKAAEAAERKRREEELMQEQRKAAEAAEMARAVENDLLQKFTNGTAGYGEDLKKWCEEQGKLLPPVEKLVCELLLSQESYQTPDLNCPWAEPDKFGAALLSLAEDNIKNQVGILVGIQFYCEKIGFPRLGGEAVVQAMFRAMYKFDLVEADAFLEWKEDESDEHERGKQKAIIQTIDWFNWLEEDEDDEDDDADYEEEDDDED